MPTKLHAARNLPTRTSVIVTGSVSSSSAVPLRRSSAQTPIVAAGTSSRYTHGCQKKNGVRSAWRRSKNIATPKVRNPASTRNVVRNTYATGESKYALNSRLNTAFMFFIFPPPFLTASS